MGDLSGRRQVSGEILCCVAVFGHGDAVLHGIERVCSALAAAMPAHLARQIAVQAAPR